MHEGRLTLTGRYQPDNQVINHMGSCATSALTRGERCNLVVHTQSVRGTKKRLELPMIKTILE